MPVTELDGFVSDLEQQVNGRLGAWYPRGEVVTGKPSVRVRPWSILVRFPINRGPGHPPAILVKVRRLPHLTARQASAVVELRDEGRVDFDTLRKLEVLAGSTPTYCAVRALDYIEPLAALVMEELRADPMSARIRNARVLLSGNHRRDVEVALERTGGILRLFHDEVGAPAEGPIVSDETGSAFADDLDFVEQRVPAAEASRIDDLRELVSRLETQVGNTVIPYGGLHRNLTCTNILVTKDLRVGLLDTHPTPGPVYSDLAELMVDLQTFDIQGLSHGRLLRKHVATFNEALLRGYFGRENHDRAALQFFVLLSMLRKWRRDEELLERPVGRRLGRAARHHAISLRRRYVIRLVERQGKRLADLHADGRA